jgi:hypothetical protein
METSVVSGYRWKSKDLERLPEEPFLSYEIIDGELIVSRKPHLRHGAIIAALSQFFRPAVKALGGLMLARPGIVWGEEAEDDVAPDIAIVLPNRLHLAVRSRSRCGPSPSCRPAPSPTPRAKLSPRRSFLAWRSPSLSC